MAFTNTLIKYYFKRPKINTVMIFPAIFSYKLIFHKTELE